MTNEGTARRDRVSEEKRSYIMSRVKSRDTQPEIRLRKELWKTGIRYRVSVRKLPGTPDVVFNKAKVVVFVDGAFWHGKKLSPSRLAEMSIYWRNKIKRNVTRDQEINSTLQAMGYLVLRFDDREVLNMPDKIARDIVLIVRERAGHLKV